MSDDIRKRLFDLMMEHDPELAMYCAEAYANVPVERKSAEKVVKPKKERSPEQVEADKKRMALVRSKKVPKVV